MKTFSPHKLVKRFRLSQSPALRLGIAGAIALLCVAGIVYLYRYEITRGVHYIKLTETGFVPGTITIAKGDTVIFTTTRGKPFWPASDLHPTHEIYPEFDPKEPIAAGNSWGFTFDKAGEWRYHDHLDPLFRGTVIVQDSRVRIISTGERMRVAKQCGQDAILGNKTQCWQDALTEALEQQGVDAAFQVFGDLYDAEVDFRQNCHGFTHILGQHAYQKFKNHEYIGVSPKTSYCNYGFYHGFMEAFLHSGNDTAKALDFCDYLESQLAGQASILSHCIHGIGHGVTDASDPITWGNVDAIIKPGLALCEKVGRDIREKDLCASGVFNSLFGNLYTQPQYRLSYDKKNPQAICRTLDKSYFKAACYEESETLLMDITHNDIREAARFIEAMSEPEYQARVIDTLMSYSARFVLNHGEYEKGIRICHALQQQLHAPCIAGLAAGFMEFGTPEKEYIQALAVCNSSLITPEEKSACFERALWVSSLHYSSQKQAMICASVEKTYRRHCPEEL